MYEVQIRTGGSLLYQFHEFECRRMLFRRLVRSLRRNSYGLFDLKDRDFLRVNAALREVKNGNTSLSVDGAAGDKLEIRVFYH